MATYLIMDTSSILRVPDGVEFREFFAKKFGEVRMLTVPSVEKEMKRVSSYYKFEMLRGDLAIIEPDKRYLNEAKKILSRFGGETLLSITDIQILALALQFSRLGRVVIVSEDMDILNVAKSLGLEIFSVTGRRPGKTFNFYKKCLSCGRLYGFDFDSCPDCGSMEYKIEKRVSR